jgi:hypothetical protein
MRALNHAGRTPLVRSLFARFILLSALLLVFSAGFVQDSRAIRYQPRPDWKVGVGLGFGRGAFENLEGEQSEYRSGASPMFHVGRMLGEHFMVGVSYEAWLIEFGTSQPGFPEKTRRTLQNLTLAFSVFPGNQRGASGGVFLRAGAGMGWAGTGFKNAVPDESQDEGVRHDEYGFGVFGEGGYEFWIAPNFTAGLSATFNYFDIGGDIVVDKAAFAAVVLNLSLYW